MISNVSHIRYTVNDMTLKNLHQTPCQHNMLLQSTTILELILKKKTKPSLKDYLLESLQTCSGKINKHQL